MARNEIIDAIINLFSQNLDYSDLKQRLIQYHPYDIASAYLELESEYQEIYYLIFSSEELAMIFSHLDSEDTSEILDTIEPEQAAPIIREMEPDDAADVLLEIETQKAQAIYELLDSESKTDISSLAKYEENTAGAIMTSSFLKFESGNDIRQAMKKLVNEAPDMETISTSFVVDTNDTLLGTIDLKKLIVTKSPKLIDEIMNPNFIHVQANDSLETVINTIRNYDVYDMPVLDNGKIVGIITMDDALESFVEEAEDDYAMLAGLTESEESDESVKLSIQKRLPWLSILLIVDIFVSVIISTFDYLFAYDALTVLVLFQPIILGLAGNSGTQSLAIAIQKIGKGELDTKKPVITHILKEISLGIASGLVLGILAFLFSLLTLSINGKIEHIYDVALVVGLAIFIALTCANLFGSLIPILLYKLKVDPAVASGPFMTTIIDILSIVIYFILATILIYNQL